ncbi:uncharacterized protein LOC127246386 isoform X2 [Andrographis paniculata]|uniref:uncharacterized protein LOC127246386 isoform X2 n=1 Tax=Andrographis paniculata TaxID=175694 RepID=UPI0021E7C861|nr:uncharacterized protein LOC127246386 isoform X2 [Andrographis paniculata]
MPKLLAEFLLERQEPFSLHHYLLERGHCRGSLDSSWFLKYGPRKRQCMVTNCSEFVKAMLGRIALLRGGRRRRERGVSSTKDFVSCSESDEQEAAAAQKGRSSMEHGNDTSPVVSVLEETNSDQPSTLDDDTAHQYECESYTTQIHSQYSINKRLLQQTKQLLIDSAREVIESENCRRQRDNKKSRAHLKKQVVGAEELWKVLCENVWIWSNESSNNIAHLLHSDYLNSLEDWETDYQKKRQGIAMEIGEELLESIINEVLVV